MICVPLIVKVIRRGLALTLPLLAGEGALRNITLSLIFPDFLQDNSLSA